MTIRTQIDYIVFRKTFQLQAVTDVKVFITRSAHNTTIVAGHFRVHTAVGKKRKYISMCLIAFGCNEYVELELAWSRLRSHSWRQRHRYMVFPETTSAGMTRWQMLWNRTFKGTASKAAKPLKDRTRNWSQAKGVHNKATREAKGKHSKPIIIWY